MSKYRVGIIGCGGMGRSHARAWSRNSRVEVVAVSDINEDAAKRLAAEFGINAVYTDHKEMLEKEGLDIVSIPTWQCARAELTVDAANAGVKGIIGEKPMSDSLAGADAMLEACEKNGVKLVIGHQRRYDPANTAIRKLVAQGAIGTPTLLHHRAKPNAGFLNTGTHAIDSWRYYLGDPETLWVIGQVSRTTDKWERRSRAEDLCMGLVCFEGGARGIYEGDLPGPGVSLPTISGTEGVMNIKDGKVWLSTHSQTGWKVIEPEPEKSNQFDDLLDWVEGKREDHRGSGYQARYTLEIMMAVFESARIRNVVTMPLQTKEYPLDLMVEDGTMPVLKPGRYDVRAPFPEQRK